MKRANSTTRPAHHAPGEGFRNPWPDAAQHGARGLLKWMLARSRRGRPVSDTATLRRAALHDRPVASSEHLRVTWIGHSSFLIQLGGVNILTDPIWSERASPVSFAGPMRLVPPAISFADLPRIDLTLISHDHYDHLDDRTVRNLIDRFPAISWVAPLGVGPFLRRRGASAVVELDWWETAVVGDASLGCTPAQHFSGRKPWNRNSTLWCGWTVRVGRTSFFFAGDTALHPEFRRIAERFGPFDLVILPIGAYEPRWFMGSVHMSPDEAVRSFSDLSAAHPTIRSVMLGSHWGTFSLTDEPADEPPALTRSAWKDAGLTSDKLWIFTHGEARTLP